MRDDTLYLKDILAAIVSIESFIAGMDLDTFHTDDKTTSAVIRKLVVIGEAVKQIPEELRQKHSQVPWKEMAGMRGELIDFYFDVHHQLGWKTITERLPQVKREIETALPSTD